MDSPAADQQTDEVYKEVVHCIDLLSEKKYEEYEKNSRPQLHEAIKNIISWEVNKNDKIIQETEKILENAKLFADTLNKVSDYLAKPRNGG